MKFLVVASAKIQEGSDVLLQLGSDSPLSLCLYVHENSLKFLTYQFS